MVQVLLSPCLTAHDALLCYEEVCLTLPSGLSLPLGSRIDVKLSITTSGGCKILLVWALPKDPLKSGKIVFFLGFWLPFLALPGVFWVGPSTKEIWQVEVARLQTNKGAYFPATKNIITASCTHTYNMFSWILFGCCDGWLLHRFLIIMCVLFSMISICPV